MKERGALWRIGLFGLLVALLSSGTAIAAGFGNRMDWWDFKTGLTVLRWAVYGGVLGGALSLAGCIEALLRRSRRGLVLAIFGLFISTAVVGLPWIWWETAKGVPPIHDITTDTRNPPSFVAILPLRRSAPNPVEYGGPEVAAQQRAAYPDVKPLIIKLPPDRAFERALAVARAQGLRIVEANQDEGRIEAIDSTFWFGFKDDVVIRITPADGGSRLDVRSVSRVGRSDIGTNAKRIRTFLKGMQKGD